MPFYTIAINQQGWGRTQARTMARALSGRIWAVRQEFIVGIWQIMAAYSDDNGITWTQEQVTNEATNQTNPCIAIDSNNYVHVCWIGFIGGWEQIQYRRRTNVWEAIENVHPWVAADNGYSSPSIGIDSFDNIHVLWSGRGWGINVGQYNIQYRPRSAAGVWGVQVGLTDSASQQRGCFLTVGYDDTIFAAWTGIGLGVFPLRHNIYFCARTAGIWGAIEFITDRNEAHRDPNLAVASDGTVHACWDGTGYGTFPAKHQLAYRNRSPAGVWGAVDVLTDVTAVAQPCWAPSIALEKTGVAHIVWYGQGWGVNIGDDNIQHRARSVAGVWGAQDNLTDEPWYQTHCKLIYSVHPYDAVRDTSPGVPLTGYMFQYLQILAWINLSAVAFTSPAAWLLAPTVITNPATAISQVSATLNGTLDDDGGEASDCGFEWGETIAYEHGATPTQSRTTGQTFSQTISGLDPNTTYHFRAFATNSAGTSYGADRSFATLLAAPAVTTDPATEVVQKLATLNGTLFSDGGEACQVKFQYGLTDAYGIDTAWQPGKVTGNTFEQTISGLEPNTTYHFRAQAKNSAGTASGADRTFITKGAPPVAFVVNKAYALSREEL